ncbi:phage morphogenesis protein, partial [Vibrio sp. 10N.261.49.A5]
MSIGVQVTGTQELERYQQLLETLSDPKHKVELLDSLGGIVESQTRRRIADEKTAPDGSPWPGWST